MRTATLVAVLLPLALIVVAVPALAATGSKPVELLPVLEGLVLILLGARLGGALFLRWGQSPVLGELLVGVVIGNLGLLGFHGFERLQQLEGLDLLAQIGVLFLLFDVGLGTSKYPRAPTFCRQCRRHVVPTTVDDGRRWGVLASRRWPIAPGCSASTDGFSKTS